MCYQQGEPASDNKDVTVPEETGPHNASLIGQISLQALLDQSTAPPGFYMSPSHDLVSARQDLDRARSTPYHVSLAHLAMLIHVYLSYS